MNLRGKTVNRAAMRAAAIALMMLAAARAVAADAPPKVDANTLDRARGLAEGGKFLEAEQLLHDVLAAIDAGQLSASDLGDIGDIGDIGRKSLRNLAARENCLCPFPLESLDH